ncbi:MAG: O-antigen ligase family protein [Hyphomonadaceae bacterium]
MTAAVLCFVFGLWPLAAFVGAGGFGPLVGVAAIATSPMSIPHMRVRAYMLVLLVFLIYAAASAFWSPQTFSLVDIDVARGVFSVNSEVLRTGLALLAGAALITLAQRLSEKGRVLIGRVATVALLVQLVAVIVLTLFEKQAITFFYGARPDDEGVQNISRNSQIMAAAAPFLIMGLAKGRGRIATSVIAVAVIAIEAALLIARGVDAGLLALVLAGACMGGVSLFKRYGFRILGGIVAALIMTAPFIFQYLSRGANANTATNSTEYRQAIWQRTLEVLQDNPILGSGVGVLRTHRDMIPEGMFANLFYIPNHPHNMPLQLWVETGVVGALLLSIVVVMVAFRLPRPGDMGTTSLRIAAILGAVIAYWVSFDLWNAWWWPVCCLLAVLTASQAHSRGQPQSSAG